MLFQTKVPTGDFIPKTGAASATKWQRYTELGSKGHIPRAKNPAQTPLANHDSSPENNPFRVLQARAANTHYHLVAQVRLIQTVFSNNLPLIRGLPEPKCPLGCRLNTTAGGQDRFKRMGLQVKGLRIPASPGLRIFFGLK